MTRTASIIFSSVIFLGGCNKSEVSQLQRQQALLESKVAAQEVEIERIRAQLTPEKAMQRAAAEKEILQNAAILEAKGKELAAVDLRRKREREQTEKERADSRLFNEEVALRVKSFQDVLFVTDNFGQKTLVRPDKSDAIEVGFKEYTNAFPFRRGASVIAIGFNAIQEIRVVRSLQESPPNLEGYTKREKACEYTSATGVKLEGYLGVGDITDSYHYGKFKGTDVLTETRYVVPLESIKMIEKPLPSDIKTLVEETMMRKKEKKTVSSSTTPSVMSENQSSKQTLADMLIDTTLRRSGFDPNTAAGEATREFVKAGLDPRLSSEQQVERINQIAERLFKSK